MNRMRFVAGLFLSLVGFTTVVSAYEEDTHDKLSEAAANDSVLAKYPTLLKGLGLVGNEKFKNSKNEDKSIVELIRDGSRFEDSTIRPLFHFFDPMHDEGLLFFTSPTWALEDKGKIHLLQNYSFGDARDTYYQALTATDKDKRQTNFGKTFEALGRIIHHVQDMAQPQHVRLDDHLKLDFTQEELPGEKRSRYEEYTKLKGGSLPVGGYGAVSFPTARSFWTTGRGEGKGLAEYTNRGFVSARTNFDDKSGRYASPAFDPNSAWDADIRRPDLFPAANMPVPPQCQDDADPCYLTFYHNEVKDSYRPTETKINDKVSTWSIFDQDLKAYNKTYTKTDPETGQTYTTNQAFSLNRFNFDEAHKFLIPRAVAYSSGLLDYFFRGKLETEDAGFTDSGISLKIKNAIERSYI